MLVCYFAGVCVILTLYRTHNKETKKGCNIFIQYLSLPHMIFEVSLLQACCWFWVRTLQGVWTGSREAGHLLGYLWCLSIRWLSVHQAHLTLQSSTAGAQRTTVHARGCRVVPKRREAGGNFCHNVKENGQNLQNTQRHVTVWTPFEFYE